ncbi:hypothetical protein AVEN_136929-1 [Araneus ventricosus]|uniref:Mos1 transposase HTH domain-containing protein n=1 Tax=Araneus ventricosus TaxID=182803 RepID=A0A4Y2BGS0_ARAVE|nr:hypothetical protein AVEN_136929-1 [Araneus ventricosus]
MAALTDAWSAIEVRSVIRFLRLKKASPAGILHHLVEVYGESVMSRKQVCKHNFLSRKQVYRTAEHVHHRDIEHPPYSLDLSPRDFHLFGPLKKHLAGRHFRTDAKVQETVVKWLRDLNLYFFYTGFDRLV